ncbi:bifunctional ADP-dependent NAD(P)H-hydrate dehydratase/NAD(P)H-hydrate epimerase [Marinospirillum alkaliphilum]|uniref:Bifunctional NAD(P)H-hydrate repair enzyme n=1 Tax=Marinospirillum alkaliphilum DSM 21637 TaxID=1122209 RepID=A0A1K1W241_9GAMM|nr:bifunctional ADP-dependent NAD(P)H-hydrate dehydratase/NAD(P)H-hydrate epimerase [Marinospirillum alkaliphilum]SFX31203.1 NAD(P)H-hydrate epimerase [Marinospirillum alkaliphilum DSM 21637]
MLLDPRRHPAAVASGFPLYTAAACAELDRQVIAAGTPGFELMQRAARSAWQVLQQRWPQASGVSVFCGGGNNGGDGLLVALYAAQAGWSVRLWLAVEPENYKGEAAEAWAAVKAYGLAPCSDDPATSDFDASEVLVDALLGIGLQGDAHGRVADWIQVINQAPGPVLALDVPSGLRVGQGQHGNAVVQADLTLTFIALKPGLFTGQGPDACGQVLLADLGIQPSRWPVSPCARLQPLPDQPLLPPRRAGNHKGSHGRVLIVGGLSGMGGAALLAARAALRTGAGMVKVLTLAEHVSAFLAAQPEIMVQALLPAPEQQLQQAMDWADVLLIGPGLGQDALAQQLWQCCRNFNGPQLVDADALNLWAAGSVPDNLQLPRVITPHPGEAARLLGCQLDQIQADRLLSVQQLASATGAVTVLKGAGSLVASPESAAEVQLCPFGNPGMGVAGMGDLLSGCIAALLAQGCQPTDAAALGVLIHALAGDDAAAEQPRGLLPSDLLPFIRRRGN